MFNPGNNDLIDQIVRHISTSLAPVDNVFHELVSDRLHIDLHHVPPDADRPFHTFVTSGMSEFPMRTPADADEFRFAELCILLEPSWRLDQEAFKDERWFWPLRLLKALARYPHDYDTWLGEGHSVALSDPPKPFARNTSLCAGLLLSPMTLGVDFSRMRRDDGAETHFWTVVPIYAAEMAFKLRHDAEGLKEAFKKNGVSDIVSPDRIQAIQADKTPGGRRWWPF